MWFSDCYRNLRARRKVVSDLSIAPILPDEDKEYVRS
jgi:hypothetical protein